MAGINLQKDQLYALDTVTFIYFLEQHPRYYPAAKDIFTQIESGRIAATCSTLIFAELLVPLFKTKETGKADKLTHILSNFPHLSIQPITSEISIDAAKLRADYGFRTPDAIHLASALRAKARSFITNDKNLQKMTTPGFCIELFG